MTNIAQNRRGVMQMALGDLLDRLTDFELERDTDDQGHLTTVTSRLAGQSVTFLVYDDEGPWTHIVGDDQTDPAAVAAALDATLHQPAATVWRIMRQDDNGNVFCAGTAPDRPAAEAAAAAFESRGHKQTYWAAPPN